jgi:hypothetical protein
MAISRKASQEWEAEAAAAAGGVELGACVGERMPRKGRIVALNES